MKYIFLLNNRWQLAFIFMDSSRQRSGLLLLSRFPLLRSTLELGFFDTLNWSVSPFPTVRVASKQLRCSPCGASCVCDPALVSLFMNTYILLFYFSSSSWSRIFEFGFHRMSMKPERVIFLNTFKHLLKLFNSDCSTWSHRMSSHAFPAAPSSLILCVHELIAAVDHQNARLKHFGKCFQ